MKKLISLALAVASICVVAGCGGPATQEYDTAPGQAGSQTTDPDTGRPAQGGEAPVID
jgi:hypothetical protein